MNPVWKQYGSAILAFAGVSLLCLWLSQWIGYQAIALVYLLSVVLLALIVSRGAILLGATLTAAGWDYLFAPPRFSFHIGSSYDRMMLATYFAVALTVGQLTARLRAERLAEQEREESSRSLYLLIQELASATDSREIAARALHQIRKAFGTEAALVFPKAEGGWQSVAASQGSWQLNEADQKAAAWTSEHNEPAGRGTAVCPEAEGLHVPLGGGTLLAGVLALRCAPGDAPRGERRKRLDSFAQQIYLALEQQRLRETEIHTHLLEESERLGRTLLNCVSHELRTPISAIAGASSGFAHSGSLTLAQRSLLGEIDSAAARLNRVVQSLLSAARLRSGQVRPQLDWCDIPELVQATLRNTAPLLGGHPVQTRLAPHLPLVRADFVLMEQALGNLLVNAALHTPAGTAIEIAGSATDKALMLEVTDNGPGLPPEEIGRIFDLFHRTSRSKPGGTGLGLAIVRGFVEAQGGTVSASNRPEGGARFQISLPVNGTPEMPEEGA